LRPQSLLEDSVQCIRPSRRDPRVCRYCPITDRRSALCVGMCRTDCAVLGGCVPRHGTGVPQCAGSELCCASEDQRTIAAVLRTSPFNFLQPPTILCTQIGPEAHSARLDIVDQGLTGLNRCVACSVLGQVSVASEVGQ
jgi:hypothetical protein